MGFLLESEFIWISINGVSIKTTVGNVRKSISNKFFENGKYFNFGFCQNIPFLSHKAGCL